MFAGSAIGIAVDRLRALAPLGLAACFALVVPIATATASAAESKSPAPIGVLAPAFASERTALTAGPNAVLLDQRPIVTLRATLLGRGPAERAKLATAILQAVLEQNGPGNVTVSIDADMVAVRLDDRVIFNLVLEDLEDRPGLTLPVAAERVRDRLQTAVLEWREARDPQRIAQALGLSLLATAICAALLWLLLAARRRARARLSREIEQARGANALTRTYAGHAHAFVRGAVTTISWLVAIVLIDVWATFVLGRFAYTRPWAERSRDWVLELVGDFALAIAQAMPGIITTTAIFLFAALIVRALSTFLGRVERGEFQFGNLDRDTAGPTRRIAAFVVWAFAVAIAYPFLPGSQSEAFKGVSVLTGLMLSLGASSAVGQIVSGLSLMYARTLRTGEYVRIGETEGTVTGIGLFATRVHTGTGEEVSLPNAFVASQPLRNFSRLVASGQFTLQAAVSVGYDTPWREVRTLLLEAARRATGITREPAPYVVQTALADFYAEYRLCATSRNDAPTKRILVLDELHGHIQDVFAEAGVQLMSPHYMADPTEPKIAARTADASTPISVSVVPPSR